MINKRKRKFSTIIVSVIIICGLSIVCKEYVIGKWNVLCQKYNQLDSYDYPSESNGWKKYGVSPVYGNEKTGPIFDPFVWKDDSVYKMCASERVSGSLVALQSYDGIKWNKIGVMLKPVKNTWEDIVNRGCVVRIDNKYLLYYTGQSNVNMGGQSSIGIATSSDGINFKRICKKPILIPQTLVERQSVMNPCVLFDKNKKVFRMWYAAGETYEPDVICYAESRDGIHWKKHHSPVLTKYERHEWEQFKVGGCQVLDTGKDYEMYYIGYQNLDVARICYATSKDGIHWSRNFNNLVLSPSKGKWDGDATYKPTVVKEKKSILLWYNGRNGAEEYIGLASKYNKNE